MRKTLISILLTALTASPAYAEANAVPEAGSVTLLSMALAGVLIGRRLSSGKSKD